MYLPTRSFRANDSLGFMLLLALILLATQLVYLKLIFFVPRPKENEASPVCSSSQPELGFSWSWSQWPGSCQLASRIWKGPTPLPWASGKMQTPRAEEAIGLRQIQNGEKNGRMFYIMTFLFLTLWGPTWWPVIGEFCRRACSTRGISNSCCLDEFCPTRINPFVCIFSNRELRRCFSTTLLLLQKIQVTKGTLLCYMKEHL